HGALWECPSGEWDWVLGVNLDGVMNGVRTFMPVLLEQDAGHMLNTSSIFGVFAGTLGPYGVSKHAVTAHPAGVGGARRRQGRGGAGRRGAVRPAVRARRLPCRGRRDGGGRHQVA